MNIEAFRDYCLGKKEVTEGFPFSSLPNALIFKVAGKMFAATDVSIYQSISVRCNPETIDELREKYSALQKPAYYSDRKWSRILMDGTISDQQIYQWIDESYAMAIATLSKKVRLELGLQPSVPSV